MARTAAIRGSLKSIRRPRRLSGAIRTPRGAASSRPGAARTRGSPTATTLICESERGYVFEVTPDGEKVWEFWNPDLVDGSRRRIYRYARLERDFVEPILAAQGQSSKR